MPKPTPAQARLIAAILKNGGTQVPGAVIFHPRAPRTATNTLNSVQRRGWVIQDERDGVAYWSVTEAGRATTPDQSTDQASNQQAPDATEQAAGEARPLYATAGAQVDAVLAAHEKQIKAPALPPIKPADPAVEASLDAKLAAANVAELAEVQRSRGTFRKPEKFIDLTAAEVNALRGRTNQTEGPLLAVIVHPRNGNAIVVGTFANPDQAAAWWAPNFNRMRADSLLYVLMPAPVEANAAVADQQAEAPTFAEGARVDADRISFKYLNADRRVHVVTGVELLRIGQIWYVKAPGGEPKNGGNHDWKIDNIMQYAHTVVRAVLVERAAAALGVKPHELSDETREAAAAGELAELVPGPVDGFALGDIVQWGGNGHADDRKWKITTLYVPTDGDRAPYAGLDLLDDPGPGTTHTAGGLHLLVKVEPVEQREHKAMLAALPGWDDLDDLDKGAALIYLAQVENEGVDYAVENYPAKFITDPRLTALDDDDACHLAGLFDDIAEDLNGDEHKRLYELALNQRH